MKILPALSLALLAVHVTRADEFNIQFDMQVVAIPEAVAILLVPDFLDPAKIEAANAQVQTLLADGTATLIDWMILNTKSGQRAVIENIDEIRYATGYQAGHVEVTVEPLEDAGNEADKTVRSKIDAQGFDPVPSEFETRNAGTTLEVEPVLSEDHQRIDLNLVPQRVWLHRFNKVTIEREEPKTKVVIEQPEFHTNKLQTSLTLKNGQRTLLGIFKVAQPAGHIVFFILRVEAKPVSG